MTPQRRTTLFQGLVGLFLTLSLAACSSLSTSGSEDAEMTSGCRNTLAQVAPDFERLASLGQVTFRSTVDGRRSLSVQVGATTLNASLTCGTTTESKKKKSGNKTRTTNQTLEVLNFEWDIQNTKGKGSDVKRIKELTRQLEQRVDSYDQT